MTVLLYTLGVVLLVVGIAASIALHELGHMVPAKKFGVKVTQYFIGFGRTLWSRRKGETEYGVKAIPLGGYVKLVGMLPPSPDDAPGTLRKSNTGLFTQLISDARAAEYEHIAEEDEPRLFYRLPWWKKVIVMAGGPTVNLVLAFMLFGGVFMVHGVPETTLTINQVSDCVIAAVPGQTVERRCTAKDPVSPAARAGLRKGDQIVSFNGTPVHTWDELTGLIRGNENGAATIVVDRQGKTQTLHTDTTVSPRIDLADQTRTVKVGFLGVTPKLELVRQGPAFVVTTMADYTWTTVTALGHLPVRVWGVARAVVGLEERDPRSPMSVVGASRVAGEVASEQTVPIMDRFVMLLMLLGGINLFVGMFNFIPLLPLDGGHIAGALYEAMRRGLARLRGRPDPGYFDVAKLLPVAYVMAGALLVMSVLLVYADIVVPVQLN